MAFPHPVCFKDAQGRFRFVNSSALKFFGAENAGEILGRHACDFLEPAPAERMRSADRAVMESDQPSVESLDSFVGPGGKTIWLSVVRVPVRDASGNVCGIWSVTREVTEERETEERLVGLNADLFAALADLKNANEELRSIQAHLVETEKMYSIGRLAASVAHEVKNPLAIIRMGIECVSQERGIDPSLGEVLSEMTEAVKRADAVIRGLLDFAAPNRMSMAESDLNEIIGRALSLVRGEVTSRRCVVRTQLDPRLPQIHCDRLKISQVFVNLFLNALHAMEQGGELSVRTYSRRSIDPAAAEGMPIGSRLVIAEVEDTGSGIPPDRLDKVFEPFFTTKPAGEGSGLGLAVSRTIVELHGGTLALVNRATGGARATVALEAGDG